MNEVIFHLKDRDSGPEEWVKVLSITDTSEGVTEHAAKQLHSKNTDIKHDDDTDD